MKRGIPLWLAVVVAVGAVVGFILCTIVMNQSAQGDTATGIVKHFGRTNEPVINGNPPQSYALSFTDGRQWVFDAPTIEVEPVAGQACTLIMRDGNVTLR